MDLSYGEEYEDFRGEVRAFLAEHWKKSAGSDSTRDRIAAFRRVAIEHGYLYRNVPRHLGGSEQPPDALRAQGFYMPLFVPPY